MTTTFGQPEARRMNVVELPEDAVSASWAPEIVAIAGNRIVDHATIRSGCWRIRWRTSGWDRRFRRPR